MMKNLSIECDSTHFNKIGGFRLLEKQLLIFIGLTWENIIQLRDMLSSVQNRQTRTGTQVLVVFCFKLCSDNWNEMLASILQLEYEQLVSEYSTAVTKSFEEDGLPYCFEITASISDNLIKDHTIKKWIKNSSEHWNLLPTCIM